MRKEDTLTSLEDRCLPSSSQVKIMVVWQSLVAESYRSFFKSFAEALGADEGRACQFGIVAPECFKELGLQKKKSPPFEPFFCNANAGRMAVSLPTWSLHTQAVFYRGFSKILRGFFKKSKKSVQVGKEEFSQNILISLAEPYSFTAFVHYLLAKVCLGSSFQFYCLSFQNIKKDFPWPIAFVQQFLFSKCSGILAPGLEQQQVLQMQGFDGKVIPFPLWFDGKLFFLPEKDERKASCLDWLPKKLQERADLGAKLLLYAGALTEAKGVLDLLDAYEASLSQEGICLVLAGTLKSTAIQDRLIRLEACQGVFFLGPLTASHLADLYRVSHLFILPSRTCSHWKEQFGRVLIEAQACGCLALGSDSGEIPQVLGDDKKVFREGDVEHMIERVLEAASLLDSPQTAKAEREKARANAVNRFSDQKLAQEFCQQILS